MMDKILAFYRSIPFRRSLAILGTLFALSQGGSAVQDLLDTRYQKREDAARVEAKEEEIIRRLDRMESKLDRIAP